MSALPAYTSLGSYPIVYLCKGDVLCADCASEEAPESVTGDVHWEGEPLHCDQCDHSIESAYGPVEDDHDSL